MRNVLFISVMFTLLTFPVFSQAGGGSTINRIVNRVDNTLNLGSTKKIVNNVPSYSGIHSNSTLRALDAPSSRALTTSTRKALASAPTIPSTSASTGFAKESTEKITFAKPLRNTASDANSAPLIKPGAANGPTSGQKFPMSVKNAAKAENPTATCVYCLREGTGTQVDHAIPRARGGDATLKNAQLACPHCNASKGAGDFPKTPPVGYVGPWPRIY